MDTNTTPNQMVRVRLETRIKIDAIAAARRWTISETVDAIADEFIAEHGIEVEPSDGVTGGNPCAAHGGK